MSRRTIWTDERRAVAIQLRAEGCSAPVIAARLGVSRASVLGHLRRESMTAATTEGRQASSPYQVPAARPNDDRLHLSLMLRALRQGAA